MICYKLDIVILFYIYVCEIVLKMRIGDTT